MTEAQIAERRTREYQEKEHDIAVARELVSKTFFDSYCTAILRKKNSGFINISNILFNFIVFRINMKEISGEDQALEVLTGEKGLLQDKASLKKW